MHGLLPRKKPFRNAVIVISLVWAMLFLYFSYAEYQQYDHTVYELALNEAKANINKDITFRRWVASHGGVYVTPDEDTPPNPYLAHLPKRDLVTTEGDKLTLMNPAYVMRQVIEKYSNDFHISGHITSLKPIRPENAPALWEAQALKQFESGQEFFIDMVEVDGQPFLRYMQPLLTESACLKCHAHQGYKEGEIRGGLSTTIPIAKYVDLAKRDFHGDLFSYALAWGIGMVGLLYGGRRIDRMFEESERARKETENMFALSSDFICITNETHFLKVNPAATKLLGYSESELLSMPYLELIHPDDVERSRQVVIDNMKVGRYVYNFNNRLRHKDGTYHWLEWSGNSDVETGLSFGVARDITERMRAEEALRKSEAQYRNLFTSTRDVIIIADNERVIRDANQPALRNVFGYELEDIQGKSARILYARHEGYDMAGEAVFASLKPVSGKLLETDCRRKDGTVFSADLYALKLLNEHGEAVGNFGIFRDVTDRKHAQELARQSDETFRKSFENTLLMMTISDIETGKYVRVNRRFLEISGFSLDEVIGKTSTELGWINLEDRGRLVSELKRSGKVRGMEIALRSKDGRIVSCLYNGEAIQIDGKPYLLSIAEDITERVQAAEKIRQSLREKEVLLKEVHHRVKNNMAVISSLLSLQASSIEDEKYINMLNESQGRIRSMALVHEHLYKSKDFSSIEVSGYINTLAHNIRLTFGGGRESSIQTDVISIEIAIDELIPLGLIINEITTNAYKHGFDGRDRLNVFISLKRHSGDKLALSISDDGEGLPEGFDVKNPAGLGLKLVQTLTRQIDGELTVQLKPAKFTIIFPEKIEHARHLSDGQGAS